MNINGGSTTMKKYPSSSSIGLGRLINTIKYSRQVKESNNLSTYDLENICKDDVKKYKEILRNQTMDQKDSSDLPSLQKIISQPEIKASYVPGELKIMGERFNPFNFKGDKLRSTIKRNVYGSLYQH